MQRLPVFLLLLGAIVLPTATNTTKRPRSTTTYRPAMKEEFNPPRTWFRADIPDPMVDVWRCGRDGRPSAVCDPNRILATQDADKLETALTLLRRSSGPCRCGDKCRLSSFHDYSGVQATVVVLPSIDIGSHPSRKARLKAIEKYAEYLRDDKYEHGLCNDDLVLLLATEDRLVYTATGEKVTPTLSDMCVDRIYAENKHFFADEQWVMGLSAMLEDYTSVLSSGSGNPCDSANTTWSIVGGIAGVLILAAIIFAVARGRCQADGGSGGGFSGGSGRHPHHHEHYGGSRTRSISVGSAGSASSGGGGGDF